MRPYRFAVWISVSGLCLCLHTVAAAAPLVDCDKGKTITKALEQAKPGETIDVQGTCRETLTIRTDGVILVGHGGAVIDGGQQTVVTVVGAQRVTLQGFTLQNGNLGLVATGGANATLRNLTLQNNANSGLRLEGQSSLELTDCTIQGNRLNGLEVDRASEAKISGSFLSQNNQLFGLILNNAASVTFAQATATVRNNTLGIQIGANSSAFIADAATTVTASNNLATGVTVVSGSTLFAFEGKIVAENNRFNHGVSANSNSNIDLDRGGTIIARNNGQDGVQLEDSLLNLFNMPGLPGSRVEASGNRRHGLSAFLESRIDLSGGSVVSSQNNHNAGILADNGSFVRLVNSTLTGNSGRDVELSFGSRADLNATNAIGTLSCDDTVLIRGNAGFTCPTP
jgi:parallel beta-helix repeat protein